jgi:chitinase
MDSHARLDTRVTRAPDGQCFAVVLPRFFVKIEDAWITTVTAAVGHIRFDGRLRRRIVAQRGVVWSGCVVSHKSNRACRNHDGDIVRQLQAIMREGTLRHGRLLRRSGTHSHGTPMMRGTSFLRPAQLMAALLLPALSLAMNVGAAAATSPPSPYRIVGYATGWNPLQTKDAGKIDTLIFAFAQLKNGSVVLDDNGAKRLQDLLALKSNNPKLKVDISVGGWSVGGFSEAASTEAGRQQFAESAAQLIVAKHADGLDVDWEYPGHHESGIKSSPQDKTNFTLLLKAIRASFDRAGAANGRTGANHYTLSVAIADGPFVSDIDIAAINPYLDWFNLMTYDFVNSLTPTTGHHTGLHASALIAGDGRTTDRAVQQFLAAGVPPKKLLIGAALYGREFADVKPDHNGLYQPYGKYVGGHNWPDLKHDCLNKRGYVRYWDDAAQAPWLWNPQTHHFITYDDPQSIAAKAAYVKAQHLGGIMYWEQTLDSGDELLNDMWRGLQ